MRTNKKILLTILSGFICFGQVFGQTDEQKAAAERQAFFDEYWNELASRINERITYKDREEYLQAVKSQLLHDNNDGTVLLDEFASEYLPNTFAKYEKAREKSLEIGQNLKSVFTKPLDDNSPEWPSYIKATEKYCQILCDEKRIQNGISYIYLFHKVGAMSDDMLAELDKSEKMNFWFEIDFKHDLNQYQIKKVEGVMEFAQKNMPETFALLEAFEKEINETKVQFDGIYAEAEKQNYFLGNTTHPVFVAFEFKYRKTIEKYNTIMQQVKNLQVEHLLLEVTGDDLASQDIKIAKEYKAFKDSLPEFVKTNAHKGVALYVEEIIETMVKIPGKDYLMGKYEVTQAQWQLIMGENPSYFKGDLSRPVEQVSWNDCQKFIEKLNSYSNEAGLTFFLPTKEQWEYACRAGSTGDWGLLADGSMGTLDAMGWYENNSGRKTHPVGQKKPNAWGLYDMHGNVGEWTAWEYRDYNPIYCGGGWDDSAWFCNTGSGSYSNRDRKLDGDDDLGFRLAARRIVELVIKAKCDGKFISGEDLVQLGGKQYDIGEAFEVIDGTNYGDAEIRCNIGGKNYSGQVSIGKVTWKGTKEFVVDLKEIKEQPRITVAGIEMVRIPDNATHKDLYFGKYEVTQAQWQAIMSNNPSCHEGDSSRPVEFVSWYGCQEFIKELNARADVKQAGITFRLPTEEEWEYACRAGSKGKYGFLAEGREGSLYEMGWYCDNSGDETHPVGQKKPNAWGLYDMHGNVWEWTASAYGSGRFNKGGSYFNFASYCESDERGWDDPDDGYYNLGFRLAASRTGK